MVSPHPSWEDDDRGYVGGETAIVVYPLRTETDGDAFFERLVEDWDEANALGVRVVYGLGTAAEGTRVLARFAELRRAWEFANLLTHVYAGRDGPGTTAELRPTEGVTLPRVVADLTAEEVLVRLFEPGPVPDAVREVVGVDAVR